MFVGSYPLRLDEKGRLALPVRFRDQVAGGMVIKKGQERCIYGLTMARVAEQSAAMAAMAPSDTAGARMAARMSFGSMVEIEPDKTGRITIPASLREYARPGPRRRHRRRGHPLRDLGRRQLGRLRGRAGSGLRRHGERGDADAVVIPGHATAR